MEIIINKELLPKYFARNTALVKEMFDKQKLFLERDGFNDNGEYKYILVINDQEFAFREKIGSEQLSKKNAPIKFLNAFRDIIKKYIISNNMQKYDFTNFATDYMSFKQSKQLYEDFREIKVGLSLALKSYEIDLIEQTLRG